MKLTSKQLRQMIREELKEAYKFGPDQSWMVGSDGSRAGARRQAGIGQDIMDKAKAMGYDDKQATVLAQDLGSEEHEPVNLNWEQGKPFILADIKKAITEIYSDWMKKNPNKKLVPEHEVALNKIPIRNPIVKKYNPEAHKAIVKSGWPSNLADAEMVAFVENSIDMTTDRVLEAMGLDYDWWEPGK